MNLYATLRKISILCSLLLTMSMARAQYVSLPDYRWGNWLKINGFSPCLIGDSINGWQLDTTCTAVQTVTNINCYGSNLTDITGIGAFRSLTTLYCNNNYLISLPSLPTRLQILGCSRNQLSTLPSLPDSLKNLGCNNNQLSSLPALPAGLQILTCFFNRITSLPALPYNLRELYCNDNPISSIPTLPAGIQRLDCSYSQISSLPTLPDSLHVLICSYNQLSSLPALPPGLQGLGCNNNQLSSLPALPSGLQGLSCDHNQLSILPALPAGLQTLLCLNNQLSSLPPLPAVLTYLDCDNNQLSGLPTLPNVLNHLSCDNNQLSSLPALPDSLVHLSCEQNPQLYCLPKIHQSNLQEFHIYHTNIQCLPNRFSAAYFDIAPDSLPLCDPSSGCDFYYSIAGNVHNDTSITCQLDSLHQSPLLKNIKVQLSHNGQVQQQFYTFNSGGYSFKTDSFTTYDVSIDTAQLPLTVSCPATNIRSMLLSAIDTVRNNENFSLKCNATEYTVASISGARFRPTFTTQVSISGGNLAQSQYNAQCSGNTSGTVTTTLSGPVRYTSSALGALTPTTVSGNTLTYTIADLNTLQAGSLDIIITTDTNAAIGSQVCITATITPSVPDANAGNNTLTQCYNVVNSLDPNVKEVYPTALQQNKSEWLTYTIHFQNTGNDTAYTVIVKDTLGNEVLPESFQYLASSHRAVIQLFGKAMVFTFPKINLVDSATNPPLSEGWIQYKVKTKPNLPLTTQVKNTAYIFFDNNAPIATNTAVSTVSITGLNNIATNGQLHLYPNPNRGSFTLESNSTSATEYRIYDMMGALVAQHRINSERELVSLPDAAAGVYTVVVKSGAESRAIRLLIEK